MERQFLLNWPGLVEEAKQRRKAQRLTQARLAKLAGVSTPTISRFESKETDIQLPTVLRIFHVLGMLDRRELLFAEETAHYDPIRKTIVFVGNDGDKTVSCAITEEALEDYFPLDKKQRKHALKVRYSGGGRAVQMGATYAAHRARIQHEARRKYLADRLEADGSVLIKAEDL